jgi:hypothetical protein
MTGSSGVTGVLGLSFDPLFMSMTAPAATAMTTTAAITMMTLLFIVSPQLFY